eukprot:3940282-Rhodomonas_salina.3
MDPTDCSRSQCCVTVRSGSVTDLLHARREGEEASSLAVEADVELAGGVLELSDSLALRRHRHVQPVGLPLDRLHQLHNHLQLLCPLLPQHESVHASLEQW